MTNSTRFADLGLDSKICQTINNLGYESPTPIQAESIPIMLAGRDLLAQAQTGTGKTASFALPIVANIDHKQHKPQALVIAPTRELAIQVAEAFQSYAKHLKDFHVAPIYGGQDYSSQLRALKRGAQVVVGTPGRIMDHMRRGSLQLQSISTFVLDEADEMLKMGFIDDIEWILSQIEHQHQTALFSATMPAPIKKIAQRYLHNPEHIFIKPQEQNVKAIAQSYILVSNKQKLEVLTRYLEVEDAQATIIFARTKNSSAELAEKLQARGYAAAALNGDMQQNLRKKTIERMKSGDLDIIVATDVAARGIDIERVSHVINYDIPYDSESYTHRIGRTGRAGRSGKALLLITPRETRLLKTIERDTHSNISEASAPTLKQMREKRSEQLIVDIAELTERKDKLKHYRQISDAIIEKVDAAGEDIVAALVCLLQQANPLSTFEITQPSEETGYHKRNAERSRKYHAERKDRKKSDTKKKPKKAFPRDDRGDKRSGDKPKRSKSASAKKGKGSPQKRSKR